MTTTDIRHTQVFRLICFNRMNEVRDVTSPSSEHSNMYLLKRTGVYTAMMLLATFRKGLCLQLHVGVAWAGKVTCGRAALLASYGRGATTEQPRQGSTEGE